MNIGEIEKILLKLRFAQGVNSPCLRDEVIGTSLLEGAGRLACFFCDFR